MQPPFLVTAVLQIFLQQPNLSVWSLQCNATLTDSYTCYAIVTRSGKSCYHVVETIFMLFKRRNQIPACFLQCWQQVQEDQTSFNSLINPHVSDYEMHNIVFLWEEGVLIILFFLLPSLYLEQGTCVILQDSSNNRTRVSKKCE